MDVTFEKNRSYFESTYLQGENISRLEDRWDWDVKEELKEGTNAIVVVKNDTIVAEQNYTVAENVDKDDENWTINNPNKRDNLVLFPTINRFTKNTCWKSY